MTADELIQASIDELVPLYDEFTTSDLQGVCMAKAMQITKDAGMVEEISDRILEGIYERIDV